MVKYRLLYFDFKGRGELIRMVFKASGQDFEDKRFKYSPPSDEWLEYKKAAPFQRLPVLEIIGDDDDENVKRLAQSISIGKYFSFILPFFF